MSRKIPVILATVFLLLAAAPAPGADGPGADDRVDERAYAFLTGVVNADDGYTIVVNEGARVRIGLETELLDVHGRKVKRYDIRPGGWVYAEGPVGYDGDVEATAVYVLPGPVRAANSYPFIKAP